MRKGATSRNDKTMPHEWKYEIFNQTIFSQFSSRIIANYTHTHKSTAVLKKSLDCGKICVFGLPKDKMKLNVALMRIGNSKRKQNISDSMIHLKSEASDFTNSRSSDAWWKWKCAKNSQFLKHLLTHCIKKAAVSVYSPNRFTCVWLFQAKSMSKSIACNQKALNQFENRSEMNETLETDQRVCMDFDLLDLNTDQSNSTSNGHSCDSMGTGLSWTIHTQAYTPNTATEWEIVTIK